MSETKQPSPEVKMVLSEFVQFQRQKYGERLESHPVEGDHAAVSLSQREAARIPGPDVS